MLALASRGTPRIRSAFGDTEGMGEPGTGSSEILARSFGLKTPRIPPFLRSVAGPVVALAAALEVGESNATADAVVEGVVGPG